MLVFILISNNCPPPSDCINNLLTSRPVCSGLPRVAITIIIATQSKPTNQTSPVGSPLLLAIFSDILTGTEQNRVYSMLYIFYNGLIMDSQYESSLLLDVWTEYVSLDCYDP